jgi:hypothetical protein
MDDGLWLQINAAASEFQKKFATRSDGTPLST